jgi:hypothetical protein
LPATVNTVGNQVYGSSVTLNPWVSSNTTTLTASGADSSIYLLGSVDSIANTNSQIASLTLNAAKASYIVGNIGQSAQIDQFTVNSPKIYLFADVYTGYGQTYNGNILIGGGTNLPFVVAKLVADAVPANLYAGLNGVYSSFLANQYSANFNYNAGKSSRIVTRGAAYTRTLVATDPNITFNGSVDDMDAGAHTLLVGSISENWSYPQININGCIGCTSKLYSVNMQTMYNTDYNSYGGIYFNQNKILTISDQTYRTYDASSFWTQSQHPNETYQPIQDSPPGRLTMITYTRFNPANNGLIMGSPPGSGIVLNTSRITINNLVAQQVVLNNGAPVAQSSFSGGSGFQAPPSSAGSSSSGSSGSGSGSSSGSNSSSKLMNMESCSFNILAE